MLNGMAAGLTSWCRARWTDDRLLRAFSAFGLGELLIRVSRLLATIVLARCLDAAELGIAATAIACFELVRVLANNGIGQMVVRASEERLAATCATAWRLTWAACIAMALVQVGIGLAIARYTGRPDLLWLIASLAGVYAFVPFGMVHTWLLQRSYRMRTLALINTAQVGTDNVLTAILAVAGLGPWAIVLPKLLTAPIWLIGTRRAITWRLDRAAGGVPLAEVVRYAAPILLSEILVAVRFNVDKMLVGAILGIEALGIYYFAFSAGYGLSMVLTSALAAASFPHLADHRLSPRELLARFDKALVGLALPITALICLQSFAAYLYVPVLFGERWEPMTTIVVVLCLSAATKSCYDLAVQLLRAAGMPTREMAAAVLFTLVLLGAFGAGLSQGLLTGVATLSVATIGMQLVFTVWARRLIAGHISTGGATPAGGAAALTGGRV